MLLGVRGWLVAFKLGVGLVGVGVGVFLYRRLVESYSKLVFHLTLFEHFVLLLLSLLIN